MQNSKKKPIREVCSAGGVIVSEHRKILFCHPAGSQRDNWRMPKGVIAEGEDQEHAALREVGEETGFQCKILRKIDAEAEYQSRDEQGPIWKRVVLFLMEPIDSIRKPDGEMDTFRWVPLGKVKEYAAENELPLILEAVEAYKLLYPVEEKKPNSKPDTPEIP